MNLYPQITHEPEDQYHAQSKSGKVMSSHLLALFRRSPYKYWATINGLTEEEPKPEYALGRAAHKLILEGTAAFNEAYIVTDGPSNPKTGAPYGKTSKAYQDWAQTLDREPVSTADFADIERMQEHCRKHPEIARLLGWGGEPECVVRAELEGVPCQIRMDWFSPEMGIIDLKTCRDIEFFDGDCRNYGYGFQMAFYRAVLRKATGLNFPVNVIAVDKTEFNIAGVWLMPETELDVCERMNTAALKRFRDCKERDDWPTGYEKVRIFSNERRS